MEVIRIPQVGLVDATGRRIGVYRDDPDWWQQLQLKHQSHNKDQLAIKNKVTTENARQLTPVTFGENGSTQNMRARLINDTNSIRENNGIREPDLSSFDYLDEDEENKECNVIGETPLHIAIMFDDFNTIRYLIEEQGYDVNQRCSGGKFSGGFDSKLTSDLIKQSKYEGLAYYGEYPLAFAACFSNKEIYDYLIDKGADPNAQDSNGNTVLHVLVINNKLDMFQYATNHPKVKALLTIKNNQDLTPVNLAAKLGRKDLFEKMLELRNIEFWRYSNITCSAYPLEGLDTVDTDGKIAWNAALSYIVNGESEDHLDMLEIGVVARLLADKWSTYAQRKFFQKLIISIIHLIFLSISVYTRAEDSDRLSVWPPPNGNTWVRYISEIAVLVGCLINLLFQAQEIYGQGFKYYFKNLIGEPANVFYLMFCILILLALPFRFIELDSSTSDITSKNVEDTLVILAIPCGWVHLLFYARVATVTGPFVVMIYKMVIGDIITFSTIYLLLLFGFSLAFFYLYKNVSKDVTTMSAYQEVLINSFQMSLGEFKARLPEFDKLYYSDFTKVVFVLFMILMHILLLNMLIAMMGNTYHQIIKKSEKSGEDKYWAQVVILLERSFSPQDLKKFQLKYGINLPSKDPAQKQVGLMVIKKAAKTKAFQKTSCNRNWKRFCKNVLKLLRENQCNAAQLLDMWVNKDSRNGKNKKDKKQINWSEYEQQNKPSLGRNLTLVNMNNNLNNSIGNSNNNPNTNNNTNNNNNANSNSNNNNNNTNKPKPEPIKLKLSLDRTKTTFQKPPESLDTNSNEKNSKPVTQLPPKYVNPKNDKLKSNTESNEVIINNLLMKETTKVNIENESKDMGGSSLSLRNVSDGEGSSKSSLSGDKKALNATSNKVFPANVNSSGNDRRNSLTKHNSLIKDYPKMDLKDMKNYKPKLSHNNNNSFDSDAGGIFKQRTSPDGGEVKENEEKF